MILVHPTHVLRGKEHEFSEGLKALDQMVRKLDELSVNRHRLEYANPEARQAQLQAILGVIGIRREALVALLNQETPAETVARKELEEETVVQA